MRGNVDVTLSCSQKEVELLQDYCEKREHLFVCLSENLQQNPHHLSIFLKNLIILANLLEVMS